MNLIIYLPQVRTLVISGYTLWYLSVVSSQVRITLWHIDVTLYLRSDVSKWNILKKGPNKTCKERDGKYHSKLIVTHLCKYKTTTLLTE